MKKYDIAILAIFKNEESFLPEWLDHYFSRNVDHIYLLNDNSTDNSVDIILSHCNNKNITLKHVNYDDCGFKEVGRQYHLYNKYFSYCLNETKWIGIFDLDEFCYCPEEKDFKKILANYNNNNDIHELVIEWYWFGSNGYVEQPKEIVRSFNRRSEKLAKYVIIDFGIKHLGYGIYWCCKSFGKTDAISKIKHHYNDYSFNGIDHVYGGPSVLRPFSYNMSDHNIMFINHYVGSVNYFIQTKAKRGSCNNIQKIKENKMIIYPYINRNEIEDNRLFNQNYE